MGRWLSGARHRDGRRDSRRKSKQEREEQYDGHDSSFVMESGEEEMVNGGDGETDHGENADFIGENGSSSSEES